MADIQDFKSVASQADNADKKLKARKKKFDESLMQKSKIGLMRRLPRKMLIIIRECIPTKILVLFRLFYFLTKGADMKDEKYWSDLRSKYCDSHCWMPCSCSGMIPKGYLKINGKINNCAVRCPHLIEKSKESKND